MTTIPTNTPEAAGLETLPPPSGPPLTGPGTPPSGSSRARASRKFPWWIVAIAVGLVGAVGVAVFLVTRDGGDDVAAPVPNVTNVAGSAAIQAVTNAGFTADPASVSTDPCDPPVATQQANGDTVTLTFAPCRSPRATPNLVGLPADAIRANARQLPFRLEVVQSGISTACNPPVAAQAPAPGTRTNFGATMVLSIPGEPEGCGIVNALPPADGRTEAFFAPLGD